MVRTATILMFLFLGFVSTSAFAVSNEQLYQLRDGMTYGEVLAVIGPPLEREEFETRREELWIYQGVELRFLDGELSYKGVERQGESVVLSVTDLADDHSGFPAGTLPETVEEQDSALAIEELLTEIMEGASGEKSARPARGGRRGR